MLKLEAATWAKLLIGRRQLDGEAGGHKLRHDGRERGLIRGLQVEDGVFQWRIGVVRLGKSSMITRPGKPERVCVCKLSFFCHGSKPGFVIASWSLSVVNPTNVTPGEPSLRSVHRALCSSIGCSAFCRPSLQRSPPSTPREHNAAWRCSPIR